MEPNTQTEQTTQSTPEQATPVTPPAQPAPASTGDHKLFAILGYILPFLFFLPLLNESSKHDDFARFHANQQLILLILGIALHFFIGNFLYMTFGYGAYMFMSLLNLALLVLVVIGVMNAAQEKKKELPVVGGIKIIK